MTLDLVSIVPWEIITQLINLLLLFLLLKHFLFKPVQNVLNARQAEIDKTYAEADAAQTRAEELRDEYEKRIADAKAEAQIEQEKKKAMNELKDEISGIAVDIASKVVEREIDEKDHEALISEFIKGVGEAS